MTAPAPADPAQPRRYTLDAMRGVAAVAVVFTHAEDLLSPLKAASGSLAVDFFFVLRRLHSCRARLQRAFGIEGDDRPRARGAIIRRWIRSAAQP